MSLVNLSLHSFFNTDTYGPDRFVKCAQFLGRRLAAGSKALDEIGLYFEADEAGDLADKFKRFSEGDASPEDFADLWNALEDWCEIRVYRNGREKTLCKLPHLPDRFAC